MLPPRIPASDESSLTFDRSIDDDLIEYENWFVPKSICASPVIVPAGATTVTFVAFKAPCVNVMSALALVTGSP